MAMNNNFKKEIPSKWIAWINKNKNKMQHPQNFEVLFAEKILSQVQDLYPEDVKPQFIFRDRKNKQRRIDFFIDNSKKGLSIAIEVDGYRKNPNDVSGMSSSEHDDFLARQNSLIMNIDCKVLRYSNNQWRYHPQEVIEEIYELTKRQLNEFNVSEQKNKDEQDKKKILESLKGDVYNIKSSMEKNNIKNNDKNLVEPIYLFCFLFFISIFIVSCFILLQKNSVFEAKPRAEVHKNIAPTASLPSVVTDVQSQTSIGPYEASSHVGEEAVVCGRVVQIKELSKMVILNFEKSYPNSPFSVVISHRNLWQFSDLASWVDTKLCVKGKIIEYKDKPELTLNTPNQLVR